MAWIQIVDKDRATAELKQIYSEIRKKRGKIAKIMEIHSLNPTAMKNHFDLYYTLMFGPSGLEREERELIAVVVSVANNCEYCINHHAEALNYYWKDHERIQRLIKGFSSLELPKRLRGMIQYAVKLTETPHLIDSTDIDLLHGCGFSDEDILNINLIVSYFNFVNRIALGLGVKSMPDEVGGYRY